MVAPNEPKILYCCWNSCIRLICTVGPAVEPQVTSRPPRFSTSSEPLKPSPPTCSNTTSTPFLLVILRTTAFEPVGAVIDDVVGADRLRLLDLVVVADGGDDGAADRLRHLDRGGADAGAAACTRMLSPGCSLALSNSMCSTVEKATGAQAASRIDTPFGTGMTSRSGMLTISRAKPSTWKPMTPPTFSHRLSRPSRQALQVPQVSAPYITTGSPALNFVTPPPVDDDFAGGLDADHHAGMRAWRRPCRESPRGRDG